MKYAIFLCCLLLLPGTAVRLGAQTPLFTYQGRLVDGGQPANGRYDLQFRLADASSGGNYLGPTLTNALLAVTNGLFTVALDFGGAVFDGSARWLEIGVRTNGSAGSYTILALRQPVTAAPYALFAHTAGVASTATNLVAGGSIFGNGAGLTNLNGATIQAGTVNSNALDAASWAMLGVGGNSWAQGTNVLLPVANTNLLLLSGFGPNFTTILAYDVGPTTNLTAANGWYFWSNALNGVTWNAYVGTNGFGVVLGPQTSVVWLTNALFPLDDEAGSGLSGFGGFPDVFAGPQNNLWFQGLDNAGRAYPGAASYYGSNYTMPAFAGQGLSASVQIPQLLSSNSYNGSVQANLAGSSNLTATALVPFTMTTRNMDNATWLGWLAGDFAAFSGRNRYGTSNTFYCLKHQLPLTVMFEGDGLIAEGNGGLFENVLSGLTNLLPIRGFIAPAVPYYGASFHYSPITLGLSSTTGSASKTSSWWPAYINLTNNAAWLTVAPAVSFTGSGYFAADTYEIDYVASPYGGSFVIATNNNAGYPGNAAASWSDMVTLSGFNAATAGKVFRWTNANVDAAMNFRLTNTGQGTNAIVAVSFINSTVRNGLVFNVQSTQSTSSDDLHNTPEAVRAPIYKSWNPTLILTDFPLYTNGLRAASFAATCDFYRTNTPGADVVIASAFNTLASAGLNVPGYVSMASTNNAVYFDGWSMVGDFYNLYARGLAAGDGGHATTAGYLFYSQLLWNYLGLTENH